LALVGFRKVSLVLLAAALRLSATEFSLQTVDGLNRPISGVEVTVSCTSVKRGILRLSNRPDRDLTYKSDQDGMVHGMYDAALCAPVSVSVDKQGYVTYSSGFRDRYVLERKFSAEEVRRIINMDGQNQLDGLRELLVGHGENFEDSAFYSESRVRPALRVLARDPQVTKRTREILSLIAMPEDLDLVLQLGPPPESPIFPDRWRYPVATALVNPGSEEAWSFLRRCALNEFNDRWVDAGAIQALKLTGSPRSQAILEEVRIKNQFRANLIASALDYIKSNPTSLSGSDLEGLAKRVAQGLQLGDWQGNRPPRLNEAGDKALVDMTFQTGMDYLVYTATFHRIDSVWTFRGAHETLQAFSPGAMRHK
jgi:hypothetical protein